MEHFVLPNLHTEVSTLQLKIEAFIHQHHLSDDLLADLSLVAEEVFVNILNHGYAKDELGRRTIKLSLGLDHKHKVYLEFRDDGSAFNPLEAPERDPDDERLGGWGIPMLRTLTDDLSYAREGQENVLTVIRGERDS